MVGVFASFCADSGTRLTFFVNGANSSWSVSAPALGAMVDFGQVRLGNHTRSHPDITRIGSAAVAVGIGALVLGLILWWAMARGFFRGRTPTRGSTEADSGGGCPSPGRVVIALWRREMCRHLTGQSGSIRRRPSPVWGRAPRSRAWSDSRAFGLRARRAAAVRPAR